MKLTYRRDDLLSGVALVASVCPGRTTRQILQCMRLVATPEELQILGTDLEVAVRYRLPGQGVDTPGEAAIPAARLLNVLKETTADDVELVVDGTVCSIISRDGRFKLLGDNPADYPEIPDFGDEGFVSVDARQFQSYASRVAFAAARDMGRYAYNGILLEVREKGLQLVATDGRRLALAGPGTKDNPLVSSAIVPVKGLQQFGRDFLAPEEHLQLKIDKRQVVVKSEHVEMGARLLEGEFPNYDEVIPKGHDKRISLDREALLAALRKAAITAGEEARSVRLAFKAGWLKIFSCQEGVGEAEVEIPAEFDGEALEITFNPDYILDYLRVAEADTVRLEFKDAMSAGLFRSGDDSAYVVMPITARPSPGG